MVPGSIPGLAEKFIAGEIRNNSVRIETSSLRPLEAGTSLQGQIRRMQQQDACGPLDMSTRSHCLGPPPSYSESLMSSTYRPSVIACAPPQSQVDGGNARKRQRQQQSGGGVSDPVIDEHFRRSLGKDYTALFSSDTSSDLNKNNNKDSVAHIGLSVDDHFAKALGETWVKLQSSQSKEKKGKLASPSKTPSAAPASTNKAALVTPRRGLLST
uniref:Transcription cofactor vestigial-like protein 4 n=1 Tax=Timema douglasi TaxID=61478 RepID=A0A7R8ZGT5_TIMDO|nr:unnamed protein product [Timema douglasi]